MSRSLPIALFTLAIAACGGEAIAPVASTTPLLRGAGVGATGGAVFTQTNAPGGNTVVSFRRAANGALTPAGSFPTGGNGSGAGLGSQGALALTDGGRFLLAVNAGSNELSSLAVGEDASLEMISVVASGGTMPIGLTVHRDLVYVVNAGDPGNISGFRLGDDGRLTPLAGSTRPLSGAGTGPAQVQFDPTGEFLVVTEKNTNRIDTYRVGADGRTAGPIVNPSAGVTPFGFAFNQHGVLVVSEAAGGAPDASTASSYVIEDDGTLRVITAAAPTTEGSACWVAITNNGRFAYTSNTGSGSLSGFAVRGGALTRLDADGRTGVTDAGPADAAFSVNSQYLYVRNGASTISILAADNADGSLSSVGSVTLPAGAVGLAAR